MNVAMSAFNLYEAAVSYCWTDHLDLQMAARAFFVSLIALLTML
jgi:hypothetical protein